MTLSQIWFGADETEDIPGAALSEARKGYERIFLLWEKRKLFPLSHKTLAQHLRKIPAPVISS